MSLIKPMGAQPQVIRFDNVSGNTHGCFLYDETLGRVYIRNGVGFFSIDSL